MTTIITDKDIDRQYANLLTVLQNCSISFEQMQDTSFNFASWYRQETVKHHPDKTNGDSKIFMALSEMNEFVRDHMHHGTLFAEMVTNKYVFGPWQPSTPPSSPAPAPAPASQEDAMFTPPCSPAPAPKPKPKARRQHRTPEQKMQDTLDKFRERVLRDMKKVASMKNHNISLDKCTELYKELAIRSRQHKKIEGCMDLAQRRVMGMLTANINRVSDYRKKCELDMLSDESDLSVLMI
jgi:hypothetical protein